MLNIKSNRFLDRVSEVIFEKTGRRTKRYDFNALCRYADNAKREAAKNNLTDMVKEDSDKVINFSSIVDEDKVKVSLTDALKNCITYDVPEPEPGK